VELTHSLHVQAHSQNLSRHHFNDMASATSELRANSKYGWHAAFTKVSRIDLSGIWKVKGSATMLWSRDGSICPTKYEYDMILKQQGSRIAEAMLETEEESEEESEEETEEGSELEDVHWLSEEEDDLTATSDSEANEYVYLGKACPDTLSEGQCASSVPVSRELMVPPCLSGKVIKSRAVRLSLTKPLPCRFVTLGIWM